jgi:polyhydroxyalkanoate synthesis regulator phasin
MLELEGIGVKLFVAVLLILMLGACERKEMNALQGRLNALEQQIADIDRQRALLTGKLEALHTQLNALQNETP